MALAEIEGHEMNFYSKPVSSKLTQFIWERLEQLMIIKFAKFLQRQNHNQKLVPNFLHAPPSSEDSQYRVLC